MFVSLLIQNFNEMKESNLNQTVNQTININDVEVSNLSKSLYDYSNRENEINTLVESISTIGQQQPITVVKKGSKYVVLDGVLRLKAVIRLNLNEIDAIVCEYPVTDEFSLSVPSNITSEYNEY